MKSAFNQADTEGSRSLNMEQVQHALGRVHGPLMAAAGAGLIFGMYKFYNKKQQSNMDWSSFLKVCISRKIVL
jgi:hypothetical protein